MQLRKNYSERGDAVCGNYRETDAYDGPYSRPIGLSHPLTLFQMAMIDG
jgi:hypothetical protein